MAYKWGLLLTNWDDPPSKGLSQETSTNLHECLNFCGFHVGQIYQSHAWYGIHIYIYIYTSRLRSRDGPAPARQLGIASGGRGRHRGADPAAGSAGWSLETPRVGSIERIPLHTRKLTSPLKRDYFSIGNTSSNHWFSGDMLVFRGVPSIGLVYLLYPPEIWV